MNDRLTPQREAEIAEHLAATENWSIGNLAARDLLAELAAVRAERDELDARARRVAISHQHFIDDHSDPGTEALAAQYELVNHLSARAGETELPLNPTENGLRVVLALLEQYDDDITPDEIRAALAHALPRDDRSDRRRRIHIDGKGDAWIDASVDVATGEWDISGITDPWKVKAASDVRAETGLLREIGRCW
ncbi:hypothetical protein ACFY2M_19615 [Streptomyces sp. NPDC001276]|uniref:hypothetical protein n=1 Tax=Streptomyces sp. NPDC001276 TaxID=3364555 RepID=UPI0036B5C1CB